MSFSKFSKFHTMAASAAFALVATFGAGQARADALTVDVAGIQSFGAVFSPLNVLKTFDIGAGSTVTALSWNVNLTAFNPSYLAEMTVYFSDTTRRRGIRLTPGFADAAAGTGTYSGAGDLNQAGLSFAVGADGLLLVEFYESLDDSSVSPDGIWNSGSLTVTYTPGVTAPVPEPETYALMLAGLGVVGWAARRRKLN